MAFAPLGAGSGGWKLSRLIQDLRSIYTLAALPGAPRGFGSIGEVTRGCGSPGHAQDLLPCWLGKHISASAGCGWLAEPSRPHPSTSPQDRGPRPSLRRSPALGALGRLGAAMRDTLGAGSLRSLVQLAWLCLLSSVPVRAGLGRGTAGLALPGSGQPQAVAAARGGGQGAEAGGSDPALGLQHGGAKVLEKTFEEWLRYRDECLRRMASEPYPAGTGRAQLRGTQSQGWGLSLSSILCSRHPRRVSQGADKADKDLHISDGIPRAGISRGAEAGVGHMGPFQGGISPFGGAGIAGLKCVCATSI